MTDWTAGEFAIMTHMKHCNQGDYVNSCIVGDDNCPALNKHPAPELIEFLDKGEAAKLHKAGYICISNKYRIVGRPDRQDWNIVLAEKLGCAPADFINRDGSGQLCERWYEHYVRSYTTDKFEVSEAIYELLRKMQ